MADNDTALTQLEGKNPIAEALAAGRSINRVYLLESAKGRASDLSKLADECQKQGAVISYVNRARLDSMAETQAHQGIIAEVAPYDYQDLDRSLEHCESQNIAPFL